MPSALTYPGVYIEEIPSGVRTITGVATSIAAFIGRAVYGPVDEPVTINSFGDFERCFGGLSVDYPLGYAVRDFYTNGGGQAIIVRLYKNPDSAADAFSKFTFDGLKFIAKTPGKWGQKLRIAIDVALPEKVVDDIKTTLALTAGDKLFNLVVRAGNVTEKFLNVTSNTQSPRRIDRVLKAESNLISFDGDWPSTQPAMADTKAAFDAYKELRAAPTDETKITTYTSAAKKIMDAASAAELELA
jgi:uncharacterized protein